MRSVRSAQPSTARALTLSNAAEAGDAARVSALLTAGARADEPLRNGETPLMRAAARGYEDVARALLDAGADANARRADGFTPLVLAVFFGHEPVVRLLLARGADATAKTRLGTTAGHWADARGFAGIAELLRSAEATRPRVASKKDGETSAHVVAAKGNEVASDDATLRAFGADGKIIGAGGKTTDAGGKTTDAGGPLTVSVRHEGPTPAHPSANAFRLGGFLRSWQASVGTALLLTAFGVAVFAVWRNNRPRENTQPTQVAPQSAPQTLAQPPAPVASVPAAQPSPLPSTTPDVPAPGVAPDATYLAPNPAAQPYYVPPVASSPGQTNASSVPVVVSESGDPPNAGAARPKRKTDAETNGATDNAPPAAGSGASSAEENSRPGASVRNSRPPATETQQPAPPSKSSPAPTPTPERRKVIQWPPQ